MVPWTLKILRARSVLSTTCVRNKISFCKHWQNKQASTMSVGQQLDNVCTCELQYGIFISVFHNFIRVSCQTFRRYFEYRLVICTLYRCTIDSLLCFVVVIHNVLSVWCPADECTSTVIDVFEFKQISIINNRK